MSLKENHINPVFESHWGKKQRYQAIVDAYYNDIFRYAYWLGKSKPLAEDLTQETFLRAWRALDSLQSPGAAKTWLFTILRRENARIYEKYRPELDDIDDFSISEPEKNEPDQQMERELLFTAMNNLTPEYREPLMLQIIAGFSGDEISGILKLNNNTVMTRLFRARNKLKADMQISDISIAGTDINR